MNAKDFAPFERMLTDLRAGQPDEPGNTANGYPRPLGVSPPMFPRSSDDGSLDYMTSYRVDHKQTMRRWVDHALVGLPADKHHLAHGITYQAAKAELNRPLRKPEHKLLAEATRDWLDARALVEARR